jgi:hypothetical protein
MTMYNPPARIVPPMVAPIGIWGFIDDGLRGVADPSSGAWEFADRAAYFAVAIPTTTVARRLWWANGATVNASYNIDVGIYRDAGHKPGVKLVSAGSTAQGSASEVQFVNITDVTLAAGLYWLAITCSSTSATILRHASAVAAMPKGARFQENSALPLPATATPVQGTGVNVYLFGFATTASP